MRVRDKKNKEQEKAALSHAPPCLTMICIYRTHNHPYHLVRIGGLEPPLLSEQDPKSCAATNYAISAYNISNHFVFNILRANQAQNPLYKTNAKIQIFFDIGISFTHFLII